MKYTVEILIEALKKYPKDAIVGASVSNCNYSDGATDYNLNIIEDCGDIIISLD